VEGRNDITAGGAKVSGISQYIGGGWLNTHGTLLYDADLGALSRLLKPDSEKFTSKAVRSVRSRVANIKGMIKQAPQGEGIYDISTPDGFMQALEMEVRHCAAKAGHPFIDFDVSGYGAAEIEGIRSARYANPGNTFQKSPPYTFRASRRFPQGKVDFYAEVRNGVVAACALRGDFIGSAPAAGMEAVLCGLPMQAYGFSQALDDRLVKACLGGIGKDAFLDMLFG